MCKIIWCIVAHAKSERPIICQKYQSEFSKSNGCETLAFGRIRISLEVGTWWFSAKDPRAPHWSKLTHLAWTAGVWVPWRDITETPSPQGKCFMSTFDWDPSNFGLSTTCIVGQILAMPVKIQQPRYCLHFPLTATAAGRGSCWLGGQGSSFGMGIHSNDIAMESRLNWFTLIRYLRCSDWIFDPWPKFCWYRSAYLSLKTRKISTPRIIARLYQSDLSYLTTYQHCKHWRIKIASCSFQKNIGLVPVWSIIITFNISRTMNSPLQHCTLLKCLSTSQGGSFQSSHIKLCHLLCGQSWDAGLLALPISESETGIHGILWPVTHSR